MLACGVRDLHHLGASLIKSIDGLEGNHGNNGKKPQNYLILDVSMHTCIPRHVFPQAGKKQTNQHIAIPSEENRKKNTA